jgi:hypothetical protein
MIVTDNVSNDNIIAQAKAGSIAAIIQLLNESLAHLKVRTRAVLEGRKLLLLCEAEREEFLDSEVIIPHVRQILEAISPPNMSRVQFFSRIVREQQLLWTQEIARNNNSQLLWSAQIVLKRPPLLKQVQELFKGTILPTSPSSLEFSVSHPMGSAFFPWFFLWGGLGVVLLVAMITIVLPYFNSRIFKPKISPDRVDTGNTLEPSTQPSSTPMPSSTGSIASIDPFVQAVRVAEIAVTDGQKATSRTEWLDLAYRWQQASDLMSQVPAEDDRYKTAQDRVITYRKNSEAALAKANEF